jgi:uncharacterized Ntn-hydrolase superfamily protein
VKEHLCATFSIAAYDPIEKSWGVAVASKHIAIGAYVPYAKAGVGAIATQSFTNVSFGHKGLALLANGLSAADALEELLNKDPDPEKRQVGIVDANGNSAAFTGANCIFWAGELLGNGYTIQGNMIAGERVLEKMEQAYLSTNGDFAHRLLASLQAGEKAGGDKRGKQAAALLVVKNTTFNAIATDTYINLRVDDHKNPVKELDRLLELHTKLYQEYLKSSGK